MKKRKLPIGGVHTFKELAGEDYTNGGVAVLIKALNSQLDNACDDYGMLI